MVGSPKAISPGHQPGGAATSLVQRFVEVAKQYPGKLAIVDRATGARVTYKNALLRTLIIARKLKAYDRGLIGIMIPTSAGAILTTVGAVMSGRTPVMINYSTGAADNCRMAQRRLGFKTILTSRALLEKINCPVVPGMVILEDLAAGISKFAKIGGLLRASLSARRICRSVHCGEPDDHVVILFTSGSEHDPKAVPLTHRNLTANIDGMHGVLDYGPKDTILGNLPLFHVFGLNTNLWLPLINAMTVVTCPNPLEFRTICNAVREEKVTMMVGTPTFLSGYLHKSEPGDFETVRLLITGADKCPEPLRQGYVDKHGKHLLEGYGATETSPVVSVNPPEANKFNCVGKVLPNIQVRIEHLETGETCGENEVGKILVKGDSVMKGYYDDFEATSLRIRGGWYDTGDMGCLDGEGYLYHSGRLGRFLKIGGEMVSLVRVEDLLQRLVPEDISCAVVEVPDAIRGGRIVAVVTGNIDEKAILKQLAAQLPKIALPWQFVTLPDLPRMASGKIDYRALTESMRERTMS